MINEDLIQQVANDLSQRLLAGRSGTTFQTRQPFLIFGEEATETVRKELLAALPDAKIIPAISSAQQSQALQSELSSCPAIILIAPSLDLASKITLLQTDCPTASLIIRALFANKRVIAVMEGPLSAAANLHLRPGLLRVLEELRGKLADMGVEFISLPELPRALNAPVGSQAPARSATALPILKINASAASQHPSQQRINAPNALSELSEFVEFLQHKPCTMEKGKPCDQCDICNTLGF